MLEVKIDGWQKGVRFSSAHTTPELGKCERLHGHTYAIHAIVRGRQDELDIVYDFVDITRTLRAIADDLDHLVLVPTKGTRTTVTAGPNEVTMVTKTGRYVFPRSDCFLLPTTSSTAENLCQFVLAELRRRAKIPDHIVEIKVGVDEGYGQGAWCSWVRGEKKATTETVTA